MSDSDGMSQKAALRNVLHKTPPSYVSHPRLVVVDATHLPAKNRNQLCACGSGKKFKKCCGVNRE